MAHRAIYDLELLRGGGGADFTNVGGKMYLDWNDVCDGGTMTQHVRLFFSNANGPHFGIFALLIPPLLRSFLKQSFKSANTVKRGKTLFLTKNNFSHQTDIFFK